jgi:hypothetical protein
VAGEVQAEVLAACQQLVQEVGRQCGRGFMEVLLDLVAQPVDEDARFGAMRAMRGLALFPSGWGLRLLFNYPGFIEFLFQR